MKRQWLVDIRKIKNLTQLEVSERAGISRSYYSGIENGSRDVKPATAQSIAAVLGFDWTFFYPTGRETSQKKQVKVS